MVIGQSSAGVEAVSAASLGFDELAPEVDLTSFESHYRVSPTLKEPESFWSDKTCFPGCCTSVQKLFFSHRRLSFASYYAFLSVSLTIVNIIFKDTLSFIACSCKHMNVTSRRGASGAEVAQVSQITPVNIPKNNSLYNYL